MDQYQTALQLGERTYYAVAEAEAEGLVAYPQSGEEVIGSAEKAKNPLHSTYAHQQHPAKYLPSHSPYTYRSTSVPKL